jgi:hypothetical protein
VVVFQVVPILAVTGALRDTTARTGQTDHPNQVTEVTEQLSTNSVEQATNRMREVLNKV